MVGCKSPAVSQLVVMAAWGTMTFCIDEATAIAKPFRWQCRCPKSRPKKTNCVIFKPILDLNVITSIVDVLHFHFSDFSDRCRPGQICSSATAGGSHGGS